MAMASQTKIALGLAGVVALALALAAVFSASASSSSSGGGGAPEPAPEPAKWTWRKCEDSAAKHHALVVEDLCLDPWPLQTGQPWSLDIALKHHGQHDVEEAEMTLKVYALKKLPVWSTTEDFCRASKKRREGDDEGAFVNMIALRRAAAAAAGAGKAGDEGAPPAFVNMIRGDDDEGESGCPLRAGERTLLHWDGDWSSWAPESDKYVVRVMVHDKQKPDPENELLCVDIDVVARRPPSASASVATS
jgi:hypothetical protein